MSAPPLGTLASGPGAPPWRLARFLRATVGKLVLAAYRTRFLGKERLPREGGYILAGNHQSYLDPILLWCGTPKPTHFIAREDLFERRIIGGGLRRFWGIPIKRGAADREAIQRATAILKAGEPVGIFPEGTRRRPGQEGSDAVDAHAGVAFIASRAGVPVIPVGIVGTDRALPRGAKVPRFPRVTFSYGEAVRPEEFEALGRREALDAMTREIMRRIGEEVERAKEA